MDEQIMASIELDSQPQKKRKRPTIKNNGQPRKKRTPKQPPVECPVCLDLVPRSKLHTLSTCNCAYCTQCLAELFESGLSNKQQNFPSTCCGYPLNLGTHEKKLPPKLRRAYQRAMEEMTSDNPLYCASVDCGTFISIDSVKDEFGTCGTCHMKTCEKCKMLKKDHLGKFTICPTELQDEKLEKLAMDREWKRCPGCYAITEKLSGCDSIRCKCKHVWCYACGKSEKSAVDSCTCNPPLVQVNSSVPITLEDESPIEIESRQVTPLPDTPDNVHLTTEEFFDFVEREILQKEL